MGQRGGEVTTEQEQELEEERECGRPRWFWTGASIALKHKGMNPSPRKPGAAVCAGSEEAEGGEWERRRGTHGDFRVSGLPAG